MTLDLAVPRRFADMDVLGHVNNVRFLDYVTAGRERLLLDAGVATATLRTHRIGFDAPMVFGRAPATVSSWVVSYETGELTVAQEVASHGHRGDGDRVVHLRTESTLAVSGAPAVGGVREGHTWRDVVAPERPHRHEHPVACRTRDLGPDGVARDDAVLEWFQEARIRYFMDLHTSGQEWSSIVVARTDVELLSGVRPDDDVAVRTRVAHLGTSSFTLRAELLAGEQRVAGSTVVAVCFDPATQRPTAMTPDHRATLEGELAG